MTELLYTARLENEGGLRNLIVTINDRENDCNLGWDTDSDADVWLQIAHLWIAAPALLAVVERFIEIGELANKEYDRLEPQVHLLTMVERLQNLDDEARAALAKVKEG